MGVMNLGEFGSFLAVVMGIVYLWINIRQKPSHPARLSWVSWLFTLELGTYLITLGALTFLLRNSRISAYIYAAVVWIFAMTLVPVSIYLLAKKRIGESA